MGNDAGFVEAFGRAALTESSARHPLFEGVHTIRITGLAREPVVTQAGDVVRLEMDGIRLEFRHAQVNRGAHVIQFNVGARDPFPSGRRERRNCCRPLPIRSVVIILFMRRTVLRTCRREPHYR
jgi:hypothetical protein